MRQETIHCDATGCGATKGPGNKWLMGWFSYSGYALGDWDSHIETERLQRESTAVHHFCGEACALKFQAQYLRREATACSN